MLYQPAGNVKSDLPHMEVCPLLPGHLCVLGRLCHQHDNASHSVTAVVLQREHCKQTGCPAQMLLNTYGKTWHTWQVDRGDPLPLGVLPLLLICFAHAASAQMSRLPTHGMHALPVHQAAQLHTMSVILPM